MYDGKAFVVGPFPRAARRRTLCIAVWSAWFEKFAVGIRKENPCRFSAGRKRQKGRLIPEKGHGYVRRSVADPDPLCAMVEKHLETKDEYTNAVTGFVGTGIPKEVWRVVVELAKEKGRDAHVTAGHVIIRKRHEGL